MASKHKGTRAERELFHKLWDHGWATLRSAGSGSTPKPNPDLIASNNDRILAIECKSISSSKKYFEKSEIEELILFARMFGAEPWLAIRFDNNGWFFFTPEDLETSRGGNLAISLEKAKSKGLKFDDVILKNK